MPEHLNGKWGKVAYPVIASLIVVIIVGIGTVSISTISDSRDIAAKFSESVVRFNSEVSRLNGAISQLSGRIETLRKEGFTSAQGNLMNERLSNTNDRIAELRRLFQDHEGRLRQLEARK